MPNDSTPSARMIAGANEAQHVIHARRSTEQPDSISGLRLVNALLRQRRRLLAAPLIMSVLAMGVTLLLPRTYTVAASFIPQISGTTSPITGLAQQLGIAGAGGDLSQSPGFYSHLLKLREVLGPIVDTPFVLHRRSSAESVTLSDVLGINGHKSNVDRREDTIDKLRDHIHVSVDPETQVVQFTVTTRDPEASAEIANRILRHVDIFNLRRRQAQAIAERGFSEDRLREAMADLRRAEDAKEAFLLRNRTYQNDPVLMTQFERLDRDISLSSQVYTNLQLAYEQSRIDAVRNTPTMLVVQNPEVPLRPDRRYLALKTIAAFAGTAVMLAVLTIFGALSASDVPEDPRTEYSELMEALKTDVRRFFLRRNGRTADKKSALAA